MCIRDSHTSLWTTAFLVTLFYSMVLNEESAITTQNQHRKCVVNEVIRLSSHASYRSNMFGNIIHPSVSMPCSCSVIVCPSNRIHSFQMSIHSVGTDVNIMPINWDNSWFIPILSITISYDPLRCKLVINCRIVEQVMQTEYLGTRLTSNNRIK